jgi:outer membrane protein OmpA-like peptidoglycan-associated protein
MNINKFAVLSMSVLAAACASTPPVNGNLESARAAVEKLSAEPDAAQRAGKPLQDSRDILAQADAAAAAHKSNAEVAHLAYLAQRNADLGEATLVEMRARDQATKAEAERNRIVLEKRDRDIAAANQKAAEAKQELADLQAKQTDRGLVMTLGDVLFDTGKDTLKAGAELNLDRLAKYMQASPGTKIIVEGHTDNTGSESTNDDLSARRALAVAKGLESRGIGADRIEAVGRGEHYPVASNNTAAGRQQNRRVEVVFSDEKGQFNPSAERAARSG